MNTKQEEALREYLKEAIVPLIEQVLVKKLGQAMSFAASELVQPQRTWVGLTRAERFEIEKAMSKYYDYQHECKTVCLPEFAAAIEAKLKEKNT